MIKNEIDINDEAYRAKLGESVVKITSSSLLRETVEFLQDYYRGCVEAHIESSFSGCITVSPLKFARMIKLIIKSSLGVRTISLTVSTNKSSLTISIYKGALLISEKELSDLFSAAENSGFEVKNEAEKIVLKSKLSKATAEDIYAVSKRIIYISMRKEFGV